MTESQINVEKEQTEQEVNIEREPFSIGGGGHDYTAGEGLKLQDYEFSADTDVLATKSDLSGKQDTLTAGDNISIEDNTISATDTTYTAGDNVSIENNTISATDTTYTAGDNVSIENNTISATDTTYTAGDNITISDDNVISATGSAQVQSDWSENDSTDPAFVQNRPLYEHIIENSIEQANTTDAGSTPDSNYVWFIEQVMDYSLASVLSGFADGDKFKVAITYSVNGTESTDSGNFILSFDGDAASLDYDAPAGNRWYGAYLAEINDATTIRFPVPVSAVGSTVYITNIEYEYVKKVDGKYLPVDGETIIVNADGELESAGGGGPTVVQATGTSTTDVMSQKAATNMIYPSGYEENQQQIWIKSTYSPYKGIKIGGQGLNLNGSFPGTGIGVGAMATGNYAIAIAGSFENTTASGKFSVAIGRRATTTHDQSMALGYDSTTTRASEVSIGANGTTRYLSNVKEPQLDHDAAPKKYVDSAIAALEARIAALEGN